MELDSLRGRLLLASPALYDPNFRRTVVLVTEHGDHGAAGLVLNRPSESTVGDVVPQLATTREVSQSAQPMPSDPVVG